MVWTPESFCNILPIQQCCLVQILYI